jgi:hypothetical protein
MGWEFCSRPSKLHINWRTRVSILQVVQYYKNDKKVYMQLQNIQQQIIECVKICYEHILWTHVEINQLLIGQNNICFSHLYF